VNELICTCTIVDIVGKVLKCFESYN